MGQEDEEVKKRVEAKNGLENYCYSIRGSIKDEKLQDKFSDEEKTTLEKKVEEALKWVESNPNAHAEEFEKQQKELESVFNPIISKVINKLVVLKEVCPEACPEASLEVLLV